MMVICDYGDKHKKKNLLLLSLDISQLQEET
jgi:hypothetical protein